MAGSKKPIRRTPISFPVDIPPVERIRACELFFYLSAVRRMKVAPTGALVLSALLTHGRLTPHQIYWLIGGDRSRTPVHSETVRIGRILQRLHAEDLVIYDRTGPVRKRRYIQWVYPTEKAQSMLDPLETEG